MIVGSLNVLATEKPSVLTSALGMIYEGIVNLAACWLAEAGRVG